MGRTQGMAHEEMLLSNNMVRSWSAKRAVLVDADVESGALAIAESLFNLFTSR